MISHSPIIVSVKYDDMDNLLISILSSDKDHKTKLNALNRILEPLKPYVKEHTKIVSRSWMMFMAKETYLSLTLPKEIILAQTSEYLNLLKFVEHWEFSWYSTLTNLSKKIIEKNQHRIIDVRSRLHIPLYGLWTVYNDQDPAKLIALKIQMLHSGRGMDSARTLKINRLLLDLEYRAGFYESVQDKSTIAEIIIPASDIINKTEKFKKLSRFIELHNPFTYASYARFVSTFQVPLKPIYAF